MKSIYKYIRNIFSGKDNEGKSLSKKDKALDYFYKNRYRFGGNEESPCMRYGIFEDPIKSHRHINIYRLKGKESSIVRYMRVLGYTDTEIEETVLNITNRDSELANLVYWAMMDGYKLRCQEEDLKIERAEA